MDKVAIRQTRKTTLSNSNLIHGILFILITFLLNCSILSSVTRNCECIVVHGDVLPDQYTLDTCYNNKRRKILKRNNESTTEATVYCAALSMQFISRRNFLPDLNFKSS